MPVEELLRVSDLSVDLRRGGSRPVRVLHGVSLSVRRGERLAVVGESGAGKSTLARAVLGMLPSSGAVRSGSVQFLGDELVGASERIWRRLRGDRIGYVAQDPMGSLDPLMRVGGQAAESVRAHRRMRRGRRRTEVERAFGEAGLEDPAAVYAAFPHQLSGGMRQRGLIGAALVNRPDLLIADEPTSALDSTVQRRILLHLDGLVTAGSLGLLIITHDFGVVTRHADSVVVLRNGEVVESGPVAQVLASPRDAYTRALLDAVPRATTRSAAGRPPHGRPASSSTARSVQTADRPTAADGADASPIVRVDAVSKRYSGSKAPALHPTTLSIERGSTLAVVGESGSGKSTLGRILLGALAPDHGSVLIGGQDLRGAARRNGRALRRQVQAVFQDPASSLDPRYSVERTLLEPMIAARSGDPRQRAEIVRKAVTDVGLPESVLSARSPELSGGQCQRVAIARALILDPAVLICDEPVSALDVLVQRQILELLRRIQHERQLAMLFISHDLGVVREIADEVLVMRYGRVLESAATETLFSSPNHPYSRELIAAAFPE